METPLLLIRQGRRSVKKNQPPARIQSRRMGLARAKVQRGTDGSLFQICSVLALAHVSPERASGRPAKGNALDRDGHEKVVFRANGPTTRLRRPVGPLGRENHPVAFRLPGRCPSLGDGLGLRPARALQFHAEQNCSACSSIQGPIFREFCGPGWDQLGSTERRPTNPRVVLAHGGPALATQAGPTLQLRARRSVKKISLPFNFALLAHFVILAIVAGGPKFHFCRFCGL